jgi:dephospho-CoA kinase
VTPGTLSIGLTGNIASGKSSVSELFRRWGGTIIDADRLAREAQQPGSPVFGAIVERFGPAIVGPGGGLDRARLRDLVLRDPAALADLNALVHPEVQRRRLALLDEARRRGDRVVVSDIPLLFEAGDPEEFDAIVLVHAPASLRLQRLVARRGLDPETARRMIEVQMPSERKRAGSDFVIDNDGDEAALERAAAAVWRVLAERA